jgi:transcriptional regulator with XRE-family HTH domain
MNMNKKGKVQIEIGTRIKMKRLENHMTQRDLAKKLGLDTGTISKMERGENSPTAKTLILLKQIFNVTIDWILTGANYLGGERYPILGKGMDLNLIDADLRELYHDLTTNQITKIKVLSFYYLFKSKKISHFLNDRVPEHLEKKS